jgi:hypothetical protein
LQPPSGCHGDYERESASIFFSLKIIPVHIAFELRSIVTDNSRDVAVPYDFTKLFPVDGIFLIDQRGRSVVDWVSAYLMVSVPKSHG